MLRAARRGAGVFDTHRIAAIDAILVGKPKPLLSWLRRTF